MAFRLLKLQLECCGTVGGWKCNDKRTTTRHIAVFSVASSTNFSFVICCAIIIWYEYYLADITRMANYISSDFI